MRQLWDEDFENIARDEALLEDNQRAVIKTRKQLQVKMLLLSHLERTLERIVVCCCMFRAMASYISVPTIVVIFPIDCCIRKP